MRVKLPEYEFVCVNQCQDVSFSVQSRVAQIVGD